MNLSAMPEKLQDIHVNSPLNGRFVIEIEMLDTDDGVLAELNLRGRTWTADPVHLHGVDMNDLYRQAGTYVQDTVSARGE